MSFIKKNWQKGATGNLTNSALRVGGALTASFVLKRFFGDKGSNATNTQKTLHNVGGPVVLLTAIAADVLLENESLRAVAQGMSIAAATHSLAVIAPSVGETFGLRGIESTPEQTEANAQAALMGGTGNVAAAELPEEFENVKAESDGNNWAEVADNIDNDKVQIKVEGADDSELMGEDEEENAKLMGMF